MLLALANSGCLFAPPPGEVKDDAGAGASDAAGKDDGATPDAAAEPAFVTCPAIDQAPALDGAAEALWSGAPVLGFKVIEAEHKADLNAGYQQDAELTLRCLHDPVNLYFFIDVIDGLMVASRPIQLDGPDSREDDAVVLFLHAAVTHSGVYGDGSHALLLPANAGDVRDLAADFGPDPLVPSGQVVNDQDGYQIEIAIDRDSIAVPLSDRLRFNLALIDDDGYSDECRDIFALQSQPEPPCIECCPGADWTTECVNYSVGEALVWCDTRVSQTLALGP
jgi:hypothetical protein